MLLFDKILSRVRSLLELLKITLPTRLQLIEILKRSFVTFAATFITSAGIAVQAAPSVTVGALAAIAVASATGAVNVVIRLIWKPALKEYIPVFPTGPAPPSPSAP